MEWPTDLQWILYGGFVFAVTVVSLMHRMGRALDGIIGRMQRIEAKVDSIDGRLTVIQMSVSKDDLDPPA